MSTTVPSSSAAASALPGTSSSRTSKIVEARRSRYGMGSQGQSQSQLGQSPEGTQAAKPKISLDTLLNTPFNQIDSTIGALKNSGSASSGLDSPHVSDEVPRAIADALKRGDVEESASLIKQDSLKDIPLPKTIYNHAETTWLHYVASNCETNTKNVIHYLLFKDEPKENKPEPLFNVNEPSKSGWTPLHQAAHAGNIQAVLSLLSHGADPAIATPDGVIPLHFFVKHNFFNSNNVDLFTIFQAFEGLLGNNKQLVNAPNNRKETPLHTACIANQADSVRFLLKNSADVNLLDKNNQTALYYAVLSGDKTIVKILLDAGADVNYPNQNSSAMIAAKNFPEIMTLLIPVSSPRLSGFQRGTASVIVSSVSGDDQKRFALTRVSSQSSLSSSQGAPPSPPITPKSAVSDIAGPRKPPRPSSKREESPRTKPKRPVSIIHRLPSDLSLGSSPEQVSVPSEAQSSS